MSWEHPLSTARIWALLFADCDMRASVDLEAERPSPFRPIWCRSNPSDHYRSRAESIVVSI